MMLREVVPDASILHEDDPSVLSCQSEPFLVGDIFVFGNAVVLRQSRETESFCSQKCRGFDPT